MATYTQQGRRCFGADGVQRCDLFNGHAGPHFSVITRNWKQHANDSGWRFAMAPDGVRARVHKEARPYGGRVLKVFCILWPPEGQKPRIELESPRNRTDVREYDLDKVDFV